MAPIVATVIGAPMKCAAVPANKCAAFEARARDAGVTVTEIGQLVEGHNQTTVLFEGQPLGLSRRAFVHGVEEKR